MAADLLAQSRADRDQVAETLLAVQQSHERLLNVARGCHDCGGGYRDQREAEIYHHGIQTVVNALEATEHQPELLQVKVLERIGAEHE